MRTTHWVERLQGWGIVAVFALVVAIPAAKVAEGFAEHQAAIDEWSVRGPACPVANGPTIATRGAKPPPPFDFQGVHFAYQIGDVSCRTLPDGVFTNAVYPVCQFDAAGGVAVTAGGRTTWFDPGIGHSAMVTVRHGRITCVVGAGYMG
ncbi:MAG: hypothetical protein ACJ798_13765 [Phenylobacterium sp.]